MNSDHRLRQYHYPVYWVFAGAYLPTPEGWPGWVKLAGWLNTKMVRTPLESANGLQFRN